MRLLYLAPFLGLTVASAIPSASRPRALNYEGYAFVYFEPNNEQLYLASSNGNDALSFKALNNNRPILTSTLGDKGVRDPFITRSVEGDKFYIIATDLCIGCGTDWGTAVRHGSRSLEIWETSDLVNFSAQRSVVVSPESYGNTWAPEAYWDDMLQTYIVYWASAIYDQANDPNHQANQYQRVVYATTRDFVTFSEPKVWQDEPPAGRIDTTMIYEGGVWYRFTKATINGCADIVQESSTNPQATLGSGDWKMQASCIGRNAGTQEVEGPCIFKTNPGDVRGKRYVLLVDEFGGTGYVPLESSDLKSGQWTYQRNFSFPITPRHGTILPITKEELEAIDAKWL